MELEELTWVVDDGHLAIGLLDFQLGGCGRDAQRIVIGGIDDHLGDLPCRPGR